MSESKLALRTQLAVSNMFKRDTYTNMSIHSYTLSAQKWCMWTWPGGNKANRKLQSRDRRLLEKMGWGRSKPRWIWLSYCSVQGWLVCLGSFSCPGSSCPGRPEWSPWLEACLILEPPDPIHSWCHPLISEGLWTFCSGSKQPFASPHLCPLNSRSVLFLPVTPSWLIPLYFDNISKCSLGGPASLSPHPPPGGISSHFSQGSDSFSPSESPFGDLSSEPQGLWVCLAP